jgi:hypothetical protein
LQTFSEAVRGDCLAISAELTLERQSTADDVKRQAEMLGRYADGIQVTDNPYAWVQMSALSAAGILVRQGIDAVPVLSCRDRNRLALKSDLLGLKALGVTSLMVMRGHRVPENHGQHGFRLDRARTGGAGRIGWRFFHWHRRQGLSSRPAMAGGIPDGASGRGCVFPSDPVVLQHGDSSPLHGTLR